MKGQRTLAKTFLIILASLIILSLTSQANSQIFAPGSSGEQIIIIVDGGTPSAPIQGASVSVNQNTNFGPLVYSGTTDASGEVSFAYSLPVGTPVGVTVVVPGIQPRYYSVGLGLYSPMAFTIYSYTSPTQPSPPSGGSTSPKGSVTCGNGCVSCSGTYSSSACSTTQTITLPQTCYVCDQFDTQYQQGLSGISSGSPGLTQSLSPASSVDNNNKDNAMWFLTCPLNPYLQGNQGGSWLFYTASVNNGQYQFIGGDVCSADRSKLTTKISLPTKIRWDDDNFATATVVNMVVYNAGRLAVKNLAYSPMLMGGVNIVSSSFSTRSYVFEQVPADAQKSMWTWSAAFADFPGTDVKNDMQVTAKASIKLESGLHLCQYKYDFSEKTSLDSALNYEIPFNSATFNLADNKIDHETVQTPILPVLSYKNVVSSPNLPVMSTSYDIFSPWNYVNPSETIAPFPIDVPGRFLFTYSKSGADALGTASSDALASATALHNAVQHYMGTFYKQAQTSLDPFGLSDPNIADPISIAAVANNYIFVLSQKSGSYYLNVMKIVPKGYFDTHGTTPPDPQWTTEDVDSWDPTWQKQWDAMADTQYSDVYVVSSIDMSAYFNSFVQQVTASPSCSGGSGSTCGSIVSFTPLNISADSNGDVYVAGKVGAAEYSSGGGEYGGYATIYYPGIMKISDATSGSTSSAVSATTGDWSTTSGVDVLSEIAASPDGTLIYAASSSTGAIYRFGSDLTQNGNPIDLTFTESLENQAQSGGSGSYAQLSIPYYLKGGGLYGVKFDGTGTNPPDVMTGDNMKDVATQFDMPSFHHPIGLANVNGYVYVLDDWRGRVGESNDCFWVFCSENGGTYFDMLVLRAISPTGSNVPLNPALFNDMLSPQSCTTNFDPQANPANGKAYAPDTYYCFQSKSQFPSASCDPTPPCELAQKTAINQYSPGAALCVSFSCLSTTSNKNTYYEPSGSYTATPEGRTWPPYGWILSANITASSSSSKHVTFCSSSNSNECTVSPSRIPTTYDGNWKPIGPALSSSYGSLEKADFSVGYDGTAGMLFKKSTKWQTCAWGWCGDWGGCIGPFCVGNELANPHYDELLISNFSVENYTKYFDGNVGAACYTDSSSDAGQVCAQLSDVSGMISPMYVAKSPMRYLESFGSAQIPTMTGFGTGAYTSTSGTSDSVTYDGQPKITISHKDAGWGTQVQISARASLDQDSIELFIDDVSVATGTGSASFVTSLSCPSDEIASCVAPGSHTVKATETTGTNVNTNSGSYTVDSTPMLILSPSVQAQGSVETISAVAYSSTDQVSIKIDGSVVAGPTTGTATYSESALSVGQHTVTASENGNDATQALYVASAALPSSGTLYPATVSLQSTITGYAMVPLTYDYDVSNQHYTNPGDGKIVATAAFSWAVPSGFDRSSNCNDVTSPSCTVTVTTASVGTYTVTVNTALKTAKQASAKIEVVQTGGGTSSNSGTLSATGISLDPDSAKLSKGQSMTFTVPQVNDPCNALVFPTDPSDASVTLYTFALTNSASDTLQAMVEGGPTYLKDMANNDYYMANITNANLVQPPQIQYNLQNDRLFGSIWANVTYCTGSASTGLDCSQNNQAVLGATRQWQYHTETYTQNGGGGGSYQTFGATPDSSYGPGLASSGYATRATAEAGSIPPSQQGSPIGFSFTDIRLPTAVPLFDFYKQVMSDSPLQLSLGATAYCVGTGSYCGSPQPLRGYQQLLYIFTDRFNNVISAPVESDVADKVTINLDVGTMIDDNNANSTTLTITGKAGVYTNFGSDFAPLKNKDIYLYYNNNLNFKDLNPLINPLYAVDCAYGIDNQNNPSSCIASNPVYTNSEDNREANAQTITYNPSFGSTGTSCNQPTQGLLKQQYFKCNVDDKQFGASLSSSCPNTGALQKCDTVYPDVAACLASPEAGTDPQSYCSSNPNDQQESAHYASYLSCAAQHVDGDKQFCEPTDFTTGNGMCTSQLGLMDVATTDSSGSFSFTTTACGSRQSTITAQFYGWPPPEPISVRQVPLVFAANIINGACSSTGGCSSALSQQSEFNYYYSPAQKSQTFQVGLFLLGFGSFDLEVVLLSMATSAVLLFREGIWNRMVRMTAKRKKRK